MQQIFTLQSIQDSVGTKLKFETQGINEEKIPDSDDEDDEEDDNNESNKDKEDKQGINDEMMGDADENEKD